jgi:hypothetical protein
MYVVLNPKDRQWPYLVRCAKAFDADILADRAKEKLDNKVAKDNDNYESFAFQAFHERMTLAARWKALTPNSNEAGPEDGNLEVEFENSDEDEVSDYDFEPTGGGAAAMDIDKETTI